VETVIYVVLEGPEIDLTLDAEYNFDQVANQIAILGTFFAEVSLVFLLFSLVDVALGILYCWDVLRGPRPILQWVTYGFGFIEVVLAFPAMIKFSLYGSALYAWLRDDSGTTDAPDASDFPKYRQIFMAWDTLMFVVSIAVVGFAIYILVLANKRPNLDHRQVCAEPSLRFLTAG
jgi:hypothetical protein